MQFCELCMIYLKSYITCCMDKGVSVICIHQHCIVNKPLQGMAPTECLLSACMLPCLTACFPACLLAFSPSYLLAYFLACFLLLACLRTPWMDRVLWRFTKPVFYCFTEQHSSITEMSLPCIMSAMYILHSQYLALIHSNLKLQFFD